MSSETHSEYGSEDEFFRLFTQPENQENTDDDIDPAVEEELKNQMNIMRKGTEF